MSLRPDDLPAISPPEPVREPRSVRANLSKGRLDSGLRWIGIGLAVALVGTLVEASFGAMNFLPGVPRITFGDAFRVTLLAWLTLMALVPGVVAFTRLVPFRRGRIVVPLLAHALGMTVFACVHLTLIALQGRAMFHIHASFFYVFLNNLRLYSFSLMAAYTGIVGLWHAVHYHRQSLQRERDAARLQRDLAEARLGALRLQLQPHFLFNTLNTIEGLARAGDTVTLVRTVGSLSELLRSVLESGPADAVPLRSEVAFLRRYLDILAVRYSDRLAVTFAIEPGTEAALVPAWILQPLVENAVIHGVESRPGANALTVRAWRADRWLWLEVEDRGDGATAAPSRPRNGIGLASTRERLEHHYGAGHELESVRDAHGARYRMRMPFEVAMPAPAETAS